MEKALGMASSALEIAATTLRTGADEHAPATSKTQNDPFGSADGRRREGLAPTSSPAHVSKATTTMATLATVGGSDGRLESRCRQRQAATARGVRRWPRTPDAGQTGRSSADPRTGPVGGQPERRIRHVHDQRLDHDGPEEYPPT